MLFNTFRFWLFFAVVFAVHYILVYQVRNVKVCQTFLLAVSLFFYACWNPRYLTLIITSAVTTWIGSIIIDNKRKVDRTWGGGVILASVLFVNLAVLFIFKYFNFCTSACCLAAGKLIGQNITPLLINTALPVGISFYTFQAIGYAIDVWRGKVKAEKSLLSYALFVTFFPQLVAGPIERTENLLPQLCRLPAFSYEKAVTGMRLCLWGMVKKVVFADTLAVFVEKAYSNIDTTPGITMIAAGVFFAFQVLCDFSGYSDIARGCASILGYDLMQNFDRPYLAHSVGEFWRRWHISLSSWLRDYVYIPLGGNRKGKIRTYINLVLTFLVSGLWHGAAGHFVLWGLLHGAWSAAERAVQDVKAARGKAAGGVCSARSRAAPLAAVDSDGGAAIGALKASGTAADGGRTTGAASSEGRAAGEGGTAASGASSGGKVLDAVHIALTFAIVVLAWVFFRADSGRQAVAVLRKMAEAPSDILAIARAASSGKASFGTGFWGTYTLKSMTVLGKCILCIAAVALYDVLGHGAVFHYAASSARLRAVRYAVYYTAGAMLYLIMVQEAPSQFLYFQF